MNIEVAYRRLHVPLREPVVGRTKRGEEFRGPCDVCGSTRSIVWIRGRCNACNQWLRKFLNPERGTHGLGLGVDDRVHAARLLDVISGGIRPTFTITLDNGHTLTSTHGGRRVGDEVFTCGAYQNTQDDYDYSLGPGGRRRLAEWTATAPPYCESCGHDGSVHRLERAHLDGDRRNNDPSNLRMWCVGCHKRHDYRYNGRRRRGEKGYPVIPARIVAVEYAGEIRTYAVLISRSRWWIGNGVCIAASGCDASMCSPLRHVTSGSLGAACSMMSPDRPWWTDARVTQAYRGLRHDRIADAVGLMQTEPRLTSPELIVGSSCARQCSSEGPT